jgi:exodeoxyribonuclease VII small subunit
MSNDIQALSFEQAMTELESIVQRLESGQESLEQSISLYERGTALRTHCEGKLNQAQLKIEKITQQPDGSLKTEEFPNG